MVFSSMAYNETKTFRDVGEGAAHIRYRDLKRRGFTKISCKYVVGVFDRKAMICFITIFSVLESMRKHLKRKILDTFTVVFWPFICIES